MLARATANKAASSSRPFTGTPRAARLAPPRRALPLVHEVVSGLAAAGDVDAPIGVVIGG